MIATKGLEILAQNPYIIVHASQGPWWVFKVIVLRFRRIAAA